MRDEPAAGSEPVERDRPTESDWREWPAHMERPLDLDEAGARRRFAGKSFDEALEVFRKFPVLGCAEDLGYMPPVPFRYYMLVFVQHVLSAAHAADKLESPDAASGLLDIVERKLAGDRDTIAPIMNDLLAAVRFVAAHQELYDANPGIYGDFTERAARIASRWNDS